MADTQIPAQSRGGHKKAARPNLPGCATCSNRRAGWFCALGSSVLADFELATSSLSVPAEVSLYTQGEDARCLYLICDGYFKLTMGRAEEQKIIVRMAGPGTLLGLYAALSRGAYEVSAVSLTTAQLRVVEREWFLNFLGNHQEVPANAMQCICEEYRFVLQDLRRFALSETVAVRLSRLLLELCQQIGEQADGGKRRFPLLLTHEEMGSMIGASRETVTRVIGEFRKEGWISIQDALMTIHQPERLRSLR